ncbi:hypothetical protein AAFF_G00300300 [Aldrovandia affinis]|uniref:Uncharacterized protein n=1 Tax=Aldrovandia affinis TaxID=143900 RepID=A0AAD7SPV8_9TELE|nr:hypothetical protein AAFF_G00300300 [Aldrovandia affinis]
MLSCSINSEIRQYLSSALRPIVGNASIKVNLPRCPARQLLKTLALGRHLLHSQSHNPSAQLPGELSHLRWSAAEAHNCIHGSSVFFLQMRVGSQKTSEYGVTEEGGEKRR